MQEDSSTYGAYALHASLGTEAVPGRIVFANWRLRFESGQAVYEIPLTRLQIARDEDAGGRIDFSDPQQPDCSLYTFDADVLKDRSLRQQACTRRQIEAIQAPAELKRRLKLTAAFMAAFAVVAVAVSMLMGAMVRLLVARVPPAWEQELGDSLMKDVKRQAVFVEDSRLKAKLDRAVSPLISTLTSNGASFKFYIIQEPLPNAFALPGGHVLITTALLDAADRPEEIAGVVAHEIAHVTRKHGFRKIISSAGPFFIFRLFAGSDSGLLGALGGSSELLIRQSFSQEYELEADAVGWDSLVAARIDPHGMIEMLEKLKLIQDNLPSDSLQVGAFQSHPATEKRIQRLEAKWRKLPDKTGFIELNWEPAK